MAVVWICVILVVVLGVPFTLLWWKSADKWAEEGSKRFKEEPDTRERVVVTRKDVELPHKAD